MGRKVDFVFSPIKVKFGLETIAGQFPGPSLGNSRPTGASLPFQHRLHVENWGGGGVGVAIEAAHWPGCQSIRVISSTLVKGPAAIFTIFLTHELRGGGGIPGVLPGYPVLQEGHGTTQNLEEDTHHPSVCNLYF